MLTRFRAISFVDVGTLVGRNSFLFGIESLVVFRDICGLDHERACKVMDWAVRALVHAVLEKAARH